jgi:prepilin-type N-terminal cleavage/methylation domain-containing protein
MGTERRHETGRILRQRASPDRQDSGFSLLELVIVVAILAVIAAVALPRLGGSTDRADEAAVKADLETLQKAIDLFTAEHHGRYPTVAAIADQLTQYTDLNGHAQAARDAAHIYGPYLRAIPPLPVGHHKGNTKIAAADGVGVGWIYDETTGEITPNPGLNEAEATTTQP